MALNSCWAIAEDKNKKLWFGSYGEGVSIYDGVKFKVISEKEGLIHNEITRLFSYGNYMYVGTSNGVSMIDVNTFEVLSLNKPPDNGLFRIQNFLNTGIKYTWSHTIQGSSKSLIRMTKNLGQSE